MVLIALFCTVSRATNWSRLSVNRYYSRQTRGKHCVFIIRLPYNFDSRSGQWLSLYFLETTSIKVFIVDDTCWNARLAVFHFKISRLPLGRRFSWSNITILDCLDFLQVFELSTVSSDLLFFLLPAWGHLRSLQDYSFSFFSPKTSLQVWLLSQE